jgi:hypothetical protein
MLENAKGQKHWNLEYVLKHESCAFVAQCILSPLAFLMHGHVNLFISPQLSFGAMTDKVCSHDSTGKGDWLIARDSSGLFSLRFG